MPGIAGVELLAGQVRHLADEFGIKKASVSGLRLICLGLKRGESGWTVVQARDRSVGTSQRKGGYDYRSGQEPHLVPHEQPVTKTCKFSGSKCDACLISALRCTTRFPCP